MATSRRAFFELARQALGTTQVGVGEVLGVSRRTAQRWTHHGVPNAYLPDLARAVYPHNPALAGEIAASLSTTLDDLGIVRAPLPPMPEASILAPLLPAPPPLPDAVVDAVVCAAAEVMSMPPGEVRAGLHAAFACAKEIGLTVDVVERVLRAKRAPGRVVLKASPVKGRDAAS